MSGSLLVTTVSDSICSIVISSLANAMWMECGLIGGMEDDMVRTMGSPFVACERALARIVEVGWLIQVGGEREVTMTTSECPPRQRIS